MSTETESIAEGEIYTAVCCLVEGEIERGDVGVVREMIDGWGDDVVLHGQNSSDGFNGASSSEQVSRHGLGGVERNILGMFTKE